MMDNKQSVQENVNNENLITAAIISTLSKNQQLSNTNVLKNLLYLRKFYSDKGLISRTLEAIPLKVTIKDKQLEESSQRYIISFVADNSTDGEIETIRTDRIDSWSGDEVKALWEPVKPGVIAIIYKTYEETGNAKAPRVRIAPFVNILNK